MGGHVIGRDDSLGESVAGMTLADLDLPRLREAMAHHKRTGRDFDEAWRLVFGTSGEDLALVKFIRKHWRAAYLNAPAPSFNIAPPDARDCRRVPLNPGPAPVLCRSGDECHRPAVMGRFGPMWCARHGEELVRLTAGMPKLVRPGNLPIGRAA